jgi:hypothetical protein
MAIWQFDLELMPNRIVPNAHDYIESVTADEGVETANWWRSNQPQVDYQKIIASAFAPLYSWSTESPRWGAEELVLVEACLADGHLEGIGVRMDVRNINRESIARVARLAAELECHLYVVETQEIVAPDVDSLVQHLAKSRAAECARDPRAFIERFARENDRRRG